MQQWLQEMAVILTKRHGRTFKKQRPGVMSQHNILEPHQNRLLRTCTGTLKSHKTRCQNPKKDEQGAFGTWTRSLSMTGSLMERKLLRRCSQCQLQVKTCEEKMQTSNLQLPVSRSNWTVLWRSDWLHLWMWLSSSSLSHQIATIFHTTVHHSSSSQDNQC